MAQLKHFAKAPRISVLSLLTLGVWASVAHATNGYFSHGYGVKSEGMAGVGIALPQDGLTAATNPAGTAFTGDRLDVGLSLFRPSRSTEISGNDLSSLGSTSLDGHYSGDGKRNFFIPEFGYTRQLSDDLSWGLAVYGNGGMNTQYDHNPFAALGGQGKAGVNLEQLFLSPSIAYKITPHQVLGVALNLAYQQFSAQGIQPFAMASASASNLSNRGTDTSTGVGARIGWIGQWGPSLRVGATWSSKISGKFDKYKGLFADQGSFDIPENYGVGLAYQPAEDWTVALDYQVIAYSDVKSVGQPIQNLTANGQPLGASQGPGFGWNDVRVVKLGISHDFSPTLTLRAGYSHATQAVPKDQTFFNILAPGVVQDHLTAGFTWKLDQHAEWSGYVAQAFSKSVHGQSSIPDSFGGGEADVRLKETLVGVSYGWKF